jgi:hypothetical protein
MVYSYWRQSEAPYSQCNCYITTIDKMLYQELFLQLESFHQVKRYFNWFLVIYGGSCSFTVNDIANVTGSMLF